MANSSKSLHSQQMRRIAPEIDPLRLGVGWTPSDLAKPWVLVETAGGDSHPCAVHLHQVAQDVRDGVIEAGGTVGRYDCTDMCDGVAQGTEAMDLSLPSRELLSMAVELHATSGHFDGMVLLAGGDKSQPGHLLAAARLNLPTIIMPGGVGELGPSDFSLEQVGTIHAQLKRGEIDRDDYDFHCEHACMSAGTCEFFGTAATMQLICEALGMALPMSALRPVHLNHHRRGARDAGRRLPGLIRENLRARDILTESALYNAMVVHAAAGGSTNVILHLAALAHELGLPFSLRQLNDINNQVPFLLNVRPSGQFANSHVWYAGGAMRLMHELKPLLRLDAMTVMGQTLGENLAYFQESGMLSRWPQFLNNLGLQARDVIRPLDNPLQLEGGIAVLWGNIAPQGAVIKRSALPKDMFQFIGQARVFYGQTAAIQAIYNGTIEPGDCMVITGQGPRAQGMPEMYYITEALASSARLSHSVALITDGRFSGATRGPAVGHISPEMAAGGPIGVIEDGDLIAIDVNQNQLNVVGTGGERQAPETVQAILNERLSRWQPPPLQPQPGLLGMYQRLAASADQGGYLNVRSV